MASMLGNVLDYLRTKTSSESDSEQGAQQVPSRRDAPTPDEEETEWVYDIEDQDDWQIVRKMDEEITDQQADEDALELEDEVAGMEDMENWQGCRAGPSKRASSCLKSWYLAPPPCFTRSAPSPNTNPLENLLIEHCSMSVYLSPIAATHTRHQTLYRSAPPLIMEETLASPRQPSPPRAPQPEDAVYERPISHKRKRRLRALARAQGGSAPGQGGDRRELAVFNRYSEEVQKQGQNEDKDKRNNKIMLGKNQINRGNALMESNVPKKTSVREGNYRCLH